MNYHGQGVCDLKKIVLEPLRHKTAEIARLRHKQARHEKQVEIAQVVDCCVGERSAHFFLWHSSAFLCALSKLCYNYPIRIQNKWAEVSR